MLAHARHHAHGMPAVSRNTNNMDMADGTLFEAWPCSRVCVCTVSNVSDDSRRRVQRFTCTPLACGVMLMARGKRLPWCLFPGQGGSHDGSCTPVANMYSSQIGSHHATFMCPAFSGERTCTMRTCTMRACMGIYGYMNATVRAPLKHAMRVRGERRPARAAYAYPCLNRAAGRGPPPDPLKAWT